MQLSPGMRRTLSVARKELLHILRDRQTLKMTLFFPVVELMMLGYAIDTNVRNIPTVVFDQAHTQESRELLRRQFVEDKEAAEFKEWEFPVDQMYGIQTVYPRMASQVSFATAKDYHDWIARLHQILALKRLGLSLARIGELLTGPDALETVLALQEQVLARDSEHLAHALALVRAALSAT